MPPKTYEKELTAMNLTDAKVELRVGYSWISTEGLPSGKFVNLSTNATAVFVIGANEESRLQLAR